MWNLLSVENSTGPAANIRDNDLKVLTINKIKIVGYQSQQGLRKNCHIFSSLGGTTVMEMNVIHTRTHRTSKWVRRFSIHVDEIRNKHNDNYKFRAMLIFKYRGVFKYTRSQNALEFRFIFTRVRHCCSHNNLPDTCDIITYLNHA